MICRSQVFASRQRIVIFSKWSSFVKINRNFLVLLTRSFQGVKLYSFVNGTLDSFTLLPRSCFDKNVLIIIKWPFCFVYMSNCDNCPVFMKKCSCSCFYPYSNSSMRPAAYSNLFQRANPLRTGLDSCSVPRIWHHGIQIPHFLE